MKNKILAVIVSSMVFTVIFSSVMTVYAGDLYISSASDLYRFAGMVNSGKSYEGENVVLTNDIVLNEKVVDVNGNLNGGSYSSWLPIGTGENPFRGTFDGKGHKISGIYIDNEDSMQGLFGAVSGATIYNVTVKDGYISTSDHAGAIAGYADSSSIISGCNNDNVSIKTNNRSGGIVGWTNNSDVYNCSSNGYCFSKRCSGGIVGDIYKNGKIYNCYNGGVVDGNELVGGITGGSTSGDIRNCINVGSILFNQGHLISGESNTRSVNNCFVLQNDSVNVGLTMGSASDSQTFATPAAEISESIVYNGKECTTVLSVLNAWVDSQTDDIYYSHWMQKSLYPYLEDGVISAVKTSYGSETSQWSNSDLEEAYKANLVPEILIGEDLTQKVTRAEFAAIAVQLYKTLTNEELTEKGAVHFVDISGNSAEKEILQASSLNIVAGISDTLYDPNSAINREQLAAMLCRTLKKYAFEDWSLDNDNDYFLDTSGVAVFADDGDISDWAKSSVYYMAKLGVIAGVDSTHFAPKNTTTEQEAEGYATATREQALVMSLRISKISDMYK